MGVIPIVFVMVAVTAMAYEPWSIKRQLRKSPFKGEEIEICVTDESFDLRSSLATTSFKWGIFTKVVRMEDGVLLFQSPHVFFWIPYSGLRTGTSQQLEELLRKHVPAHKIVEHAMRSNTG